MAYVAVKGGQDAINEANLLLEYDIVKSGKILEIETIKERLTDLVYQVMSEASLYDEDLAALAIKQANGSMEEAVFLLRAHRSTLSRLYYSTITDTNNMEVERRITASFKDVPGGQFLGKAKDFTQRFLNFDLINEDLVAMDDRKVEIESAEVEETNDDLSKLPRVIDYLEKEGLYKRRENDDSEPDDITKKAISFPSTRSQRLQSLTRGQTGAVTSLGYAQIRGFGTASHPNIGELRVGTIPIHIMKDTDREEKDEYYIGAIKVTEVETFSKTEQDKNADNLLGYEIGYGLVYGQNESKAISMSVLDYSLEYSIKDGSPPGDDEFVLLHIDSVESSGFISHLKLPHYVTFQSSLDGVRSINKKEEDENDR